MAIFSAIKRRGRSFSISELPNFSPIMQTYATLVLFLLIPAVFSEDFNSTTDAVLETDYENETEIVAPQRDFIGDDFYGDSFHGHFYEHAHIFGPDFYESFHPHISYPSHFYHHHHHHHHRNTRIGGFIPQLLSHITPGAWKELFRICQNNTITEAQKEAAIWEWAPRQGQDVYVCFLSCLFLFG